MARLQSTTSTTSTTSRNNKAALRETVNSWLHGMLMHMAEARAADYRVKQRIGEIKGLYKALTDEQYRNKLKVDYDLRDAIDAYQHHCQEVQRYASAIQAMAAGHTLLEQLPTV